MHQAPLSVLEEIAARGRIAEPVRVGLIGAGVFGSGFIASSAEQRGINVVGIADLDIGKVRSLFEGVGWRWGERPASLSDVDATSHPYVTDDSSELIDRAHVDILVEATGIAALGARHAMQAIDEGIDIVMVNVEADALVGQALATRASKAGVVYSLAYGDQPAIICDMIDWARLNGFTVTCAGKGTKFLTSYLDVAPDNVWETYDFAPGYPEKHGLNPRMYTSFRDGTKSAIEMCAVSNAARLAPPIGGLQYPPAGARDLPQVLRPRESGGVLDHDGTVEVVSSVRRDGSEIDDHLEFGIYVVIRPLNAIAQRLAAEHGLLVDDSGNYAATYRPHHIVGLELGTTVARMAIHRHATGRPQAFLADAVTVARQDLKKGQVLDGIGGYHVRAQMTTARMSVSDGLLPIGLSAGVTLEHNVAKGEYIRMHQVSGTDHEIAELRSEMQPGG